MSEAAIRFREAKSSGRLTRMRGGATCQADGLFVEMAGSVSIAGPLMTRAETLVSWSDVEQVSRRRKFMKPWKVHVRIVAGTLEPFSTFPDADGFKLEVRTTSPRQEVQAFLSEANLAIAEAETIKQRQRIESSLKGA